MSRVIAWVVALAALSCASDVDTATQLLVKIEADPALTDKLSAIRLQLFDPDATDEAKPMEERTFALTHGRPSAERQRLPFSFGIAKGSLERLKIVIKGYESEDPEAEPMIEQKLVTSFQPDAARWVAISLWESCFNLPRACVGLDRTCAPASGIGATATDGECGVVEEIDALASEPKQVASAESAATSASGCETARLCTLPDYPCVESQSSGYECRGQFAEWPIPTIHGDARAQPRYHSEGGSSVVDEVTGLIWQRQVPKSYYGCTGRSNDLGSRCTFQEARDYCAQVKLDQADWRVPTKIELESLVSETRGPPAIDELFDFPLEDDFNGNKFWTASPVVDSSQPPSAFFVDFGFGFTDYDEQSLLLRVRCVRSVTTRAGTPAGRYQLDDNQVTDDRTGLIWQRGHNGPFEYQSQAADSCSSIGDDWRLPSAKELLSLVDPSRPPPAVDPIFADEPERFYWTATRSLIPDEILGSRDAVRDVGPWYLVHPYTGGSSDARIALIQLPRLAPDKPELLLFYARCVKTR